MEEFYLPPQSLWLLHRCCNRRFSLPSFQLRRCPTPLPPRFFSSETQSHLLLSLMLLCSATDALLQAPLPRELLFHNYATAGVFIVFRIATLKFHYRRLVRLKLLFCSLTHICYNSTTMYLRGSHTRVFSIATLPDLSPSHRDHELSRGALRCCMKYLHGCWVPSFAYYPETTPCATTFESLKERLVSILINCVRLSASYNTNSVLCTVLRSSTSLFCVLLLHDRHRNQLHTRM